MSNKNNNEFKLSSWAIENKMTVYVMMVIILFLGLSAYYSMPREDFPEIKETKIYISTVYPGNTAEDIERLIVDPLEEEIKNVSNVVKVLSTSQEDYGIITVEFDEKITVEAAKQKIKDKIDTKIGGEDWPTFNGAKVEPNVFDLNISEEVPILNINLKGDYPIEKLKVFGEYLEDEIEALEEIKQVDIRGAQEKEVEVAVDIYKMMASKVSFDDVINAVRNGNVTMSAGNLVANEQRRTIRILGEVENPSDLENFVVKTQGGAVYLKDIAEVEFGSLDYDVLSKENGKPSAAIIMKQRPGSNAKEVIENVKEKMAYLKETQFPPGMDYTIGYDVSRFLDASIHEVIKTLLEAFFLVALVVFLFLQDWRSTLIPIIAVPVSLIGTFAFMQLFGFSINMLTLFALVLAIGIVVDDAIVVVEAVHAKMEEKHLSPYKAVREVMGEISGAIIAITLVMVSVFLPIAFMSGPVGTFYRQFSITMAISIIISGINALTLAPALCSMILKGHNHHPKPKNALNKFFDAFNKNYDFFSDKYKNFLKSVITRRTLTIGVLAAFSMGTWGVSKVLPTGFIPTEDQGTIYANVTTPAGATIERTEQVMNEIDKIALKINAVENTSTLAGYSMMTEGSGASFGMSTISLKPWKERDLSAKQIIEILEKNTEHIKGADIQFLPPPAVPGFGNASGFEMRILDKSGSGDLIKLDGVTQEFLEELRKRPEIKEVFTGFNPNFPQYLVRIDQDVAAKKGITVDAALSNLQSLIGSFYATNFIRFNQMYKVMIQAHPSYRALPEDVLKLRVKNKYGEMVPYSIFCNIERVYGPEQLTRYNMYYASMINGESAPGYSSGDAIKAIEETIEKTLPKGYTHEYSGMTREEILSGNQVIVIFSICLLFVYLLLSAQYESFILPFSVLLSLPIGIFGSLFLLYITGLENNIYAQVAMVMLIGLLGKNAILIIEFALLKQKEGRTIIQAAMEGAVARLRPILMTSFAFIAGLIPLMMASGAGAIGNKTIGTAAAGGMLLGTMLGVLVIPGLFVIFAGIETRFKRKTKNKVRKGAYV